jgi:hypothetical protein
MIVDVFLKNSLLFSLIFGKTGWLATAKAKATKKLLAANCGSLSQNLSRSFRISGANDPHYEHTRIFPPPHPISSWHLRWVLS